MKGFFGRILYIDLSRRTYRSDAVDDSVLSRYLGGKGLATHLLLEGNPPGVDPFSEENNLIFALGPVTDTPVHGSSRYGVFTKSPLTGFYSESYSGGKTAEPMSRAGYDAVVLYGKSTEPVFLEISDRGVGFHDASGLWGKGTYETEDALLKAVDARGAKAVVIGPAGENLVRFALIGNDHWRCAGRTGVGAVMGSKKVKGIVFYGEAKRELAHGDLVEEFRRKTLAKAKDNPGVAAYRNLGTPMMVALLTPVASFPSRYWSQGRCEHWERLAAETMKERLSTRPRACSKCFMACGKLSEVREGRHKGLKIEGPEYETIYAFGGLCMIDRIEEIAYLNDLCDNLGLDTITAGNLAAFAIEASLRGRIPDRLDYGDVDGVARLLDGIVNRDGIGAVLAEGIRFASREWGLEDLAIHVKGMEPAGYDPRSLKGMGLAFATSDRGACHLRTTFYKPELAGISPPDRMEGKARIFVDYEDRLNIFDTMIFCRFFRDLYLWDDLREVIMATTGLDLKEEELRRIACNIADATRAFNIREGLTREDDTLPRRFFEEPIEEGRIFKREDFDRLLAEYYQLRGWDEEGVPP
ncbi:MAG: aldehyde ferredoxin oxidoreductase family protein [Deltaproteobacteria bacterium]|nr:aldehyde ferredoxin oxidoreductase family protein [Deltaproteobacteria bacterium]